MFTSRNLPTSVKVVWVEVWTRLETPDIINGVFVNDIKVGVELSTILGSVTVNVMSVKGQNSGFSLGEMLCENDKLKMKLAASSNSKFFFMLIMIKVYFSK
jgi:uncharacterized membrane protein